LLFNLLDDNPPGSGDQNRSQNMNTHRTILVWLIVSSAVVLCGFKKTVKNKHSASRQAKTTKVETAKPLNLATPGGAALGGVAGTGNVEDNANVGLFDADMAKHQQTVGLRGQVILSQEPEVGKMKSADGAGIVFDFHH
jgi:hypothetical protein